jgi:hypothetical protein
MRPGPATTASTLWAALALCAAASVRAASGNVSGIVQSASTGEPLTNGAVSLTINGVQWGAAAPVDAAGGFNFGTVTWAVGSSVSIEVQISAPGLLDGSTLGTLTAGGSAYAYIHRPGSTISGTVTDALAGTPISSGTVLVYDSAAVQLGAAEVNAQGIYRFGGLPFGTDYARTDFPDYLDKLWSDIPCTGGNCSIASGMPIVLPDEVSNLVADFQLEPNLIFADDFGG